MYTTLIAAAIFGFTSAEWTIPSFCGKSNCPKFKLVNEANPMVRKYDASTWVTTRQRGLIYDFAMMPMFMRLFRYIDGNNAAGKKIDMTAPVICKVTPGSPYNFEMSFYLDIEDAPKPKNDNVYLTSLPQDFEVFVKEYDGFSFGATSRRKFRELRYELDSQSPDYNATYYYTAGYDGPWKFINRHNEIWIPRN